MVTNLDRKDVEILKMLRIDSRTPMGLIGDKLKISKATVSRRVASMEDDGTIAKYSLDVDLTSMGVMKSLVSMQIVGSPAAVIIEQLKGYEEIGHIYKTFGDHNLVCEVYTHNVDELYEMIQSKMLKMPSVRNVEVDILLEGEDINQNADLKLFEKGLKE
ncbi:MAG: Lrp/AsnC family transcriptional regulator [Candidatus Methanomethylophilaceae archaeon]|nr:Lrp/AsnC family transcriptional regulator [Candidatus Methanomethylophilaceae archaeon]MBQ6548039.1 Lrp/AsnC family transcriptional regulator [Candidatus Methanomethylophilaceae archaeon]